MSVGIIEEISGKLRDAACDPLGWSTALDSINKFVGGSGIALLSVDERLKHAPASKENEAMLEDYIEEGWCANDPRDACVPLLASQGVVLDYQFQDMTQIERYYDEFLRRHRCKWFAGIGANVEGALWCLAIQRSPDAGAFLSGDLPKLNIVRGIFADAARYANATSRNWLQGAFDAFDIAGSAAFTVDLAAFVIHMNVGARAIIGAYVDRFGGIRTQVGKSSRALSEVLHAHLCQRAHQEKKNIAVQVGGQNYIFELNDLRGEAKFTFSKAAALVRILAPIPDPASALKSVYGLTDAELRVALALASGLSVLEIAENFRVKPNTIRTQLKVAYAKTNAGSQSKLVALVAQLNRAP